MYTIDNEKLAEVTRIINAETDPKATEELIEAEICGDWNEGAAKARLLQMFEAVGLEDAWTTATRRRLSTILFG